MRVIELEETDSTNEYLKRLNPSEDTAVFAKRQTAGRGTKGRSFSSREGGLFVSVCRLYEGLPASNAFEIMVNCCVAVCKTLEYFGVKPVIRWANDVLVNGKKICGTLIENTFSGGNITRSIVGMGINVNNVIPDELKDIAVSLSVLGKNIEVEQVKEVLMTNLTGNYAVSDYKKYVDWLGKKVTLKCGGESFTAIALDIGDDGRLIAEREGEVIKISSAEVSLRL